MRTNMSSRTAPLLLLAFLLILTCSVLANAQAVRRTVPTTESGTIQKGTEFRVAITPTTEIGVVIPEGNGFRVELSEEQLSKVYPQPSASRANERVAQPVGKEELRQAVMSDALLKVKTLFPNGVPEGALGKIKITVTVKFSKPPEVGLSVQW